MKKKDIGMLAKSIAGHDTGQLYVIMDADLAYVYLADGKIRTLRKLKKKSRKHVQLICRQYDVTAADNEAVKRILKEYKIHLYREKEN